MSVLSVGCGRGGEMCPCLGVSERESVEEEKRNRIALMKKRRRRMGRREMRK